MPPSRAGRQTFLIAVLASLATGLPCAARPAVRAAGRNPLRGSKNSVSKLHIDPEVEPNNTIQTATPLVFHGPAAVASGQISPGADVDVYSFVAPPDSQVWISTDAGGLSLPGSNSRNTRLLLLDADGDQLESDRDDGTCNGGDGTIESEGCSAIAGYVLSAGGTYYALVGASADTDVIKPYSVYVLITYGVTGTEAEPNDTAATANTLGVGSNSFGVTNGAIDHAGDVDVYKVSARALDRLFFAVDENPDGDEPTDVAIDLLASDGSTVLLTVDGSAGDENSAEAADYRLGAAGSYYLRVRHAGAGTGTYTIAVTELSLFAHCLTTKDAVLGSDSAGYPADHESFANRIVRSGVASQCGPAVCPGIDVDAGAHTFDAYTFYNDSDTEECMSVRVQTACTELFVAAYQGAFEPDALCDHYLGDSGGSLAPDGIFSFAVGPHEKYIVVVSEIVAGAGCAAYTIEFEGTCASGLVVDASLDLGTSSNLNGVLETGETVLVEPSWRGSTTGLELTGGVTSFDGPAGPTYTVPDNSADYGAPADGEVADCLANDDCYQVKVAGARPEAHWDVSMTEVTNVAPPFPWTVHVGGSFADVPQTDLFYPHIENVFHNGVTGGGSCGGYCPNEPALRKQMAVFVLKAKEGPAYVPPPASGIFADVAASNPFAPWIEELFHRGVVAGCAAPGGPKYCPDAPVLRQQMAVFLLKTLLGADYVPPPAAGTFADVPIGSPFAPFIEDLAARHIAAGCGGLNFCPTNPNLRKQMAPFLVKTFGLVLYGH